MLYKKIILAVFLSSLVITGSWYYHNVKARALVSGVINSPADNLMTIDGRTNLVILGIGGEGHTGSDLTDTIIFISLNLTSRKALMVPIPRDFWITSLKAKVNTAYHYGEQRREGGGRDLIKSAVSEIVGQPIHYAVVIDFAGFEKAIDAVGGIDVEVTRAFDDYQYPLPGKEDAEPESARYEHLHFDAGLTHMDGSLALKFTRSRHAEGDEGTDFARSARQEKIILAFRDKLLSSKTLLNTSALKSLSTSLSSSIDTDVTEKEYGSFLKLFLSMDPHSSLTTLSLEDQLINPKNTKPYSGQWVLIPGSSLENLHAYVKDHLPN